MNRIPASHKSDEIDLPELSGMSFDANGKQKHVPIVQEFVDDWLNCEDSDVLIIMGSMGAGKTHALHSIASRIDSAETISFDQLVDMNKGDALSALSQLSYDSPTHFILIDNFDSINSILGYQNPPPDLRYIKDLKAHHRIIITTRRELHQPDDELVHQLTSSQRLDNLGINQPWILQIRPWSVSELSAHLKNIVGDHRPLIQFLEKNKAFEFIRRPQIVKMLLRIEEKLQSISENKIASQIFDEFCKASLTKDFDMQRSRLSFTAKDNILSDLAFDIFSGVPTSKCDYFSPLTLPIERVSSRVMETMSKDKSIKMNHDTYQYNWTEDFISTNHLFSEVKPIAHSKFARSQYGFSNQSIYEYYVSSSILKKLFNAETLHLELNNITSQTFNSLSLSFCKERGGSELRSQVKVIVKGNLGSADRLFLMYFLEDESDFVELLEQSPDEYKSFLSSNKDSQLDFFISKMIRYQLVVLGKYNAIDYVNQLKLHEKESDVLGELRLHSSESDVTGQLIDRLNNPSLLNARAITIYRLGQLGTTLAIAELNKIAEDNELVELAGLAAKMIETRHS